MSVKIENAQQLLQLSEKWKQSLDRQVEKILVCGGTGCLASGSLEIYNELKKLIAERNLLLEVDLDMEEEGVSVKKSGCHGFCEVGPLVRVEPQNFLYLKVKVEDCLEIVEKTVLNKLPIERLMYKLDGKVFPTQEEIPFYQRQTRVVLEHCGHMDAENIQEYIALGGYTAFSKALTEMTSADVCKMMEDANLRGRGGGGFPTGKKWAQVARQSNPRKFVVCNGDEGDPGAFMDRSIMEGDPHRVIEGMMIAGIATGAKEGCVYVRAEYPMAVERLTLAIKQAKALGLLGKNVLGTDFCFDISINQGAGAFVCGEGSALTASIEGERGMPRVKPPRTVEQGLWACPTVLNNVETFANVPIIVGKGVQNFKRFGTETSSGTKAFALTGNVVNTGLIEVPMGTTLREVIFNIGGGIPGGKKFKAVQIGGPSGGCLCFVDKHLDMQLDFDSLQKVGAMIGSGGMVVMDEDTCMVEVARFFMNFTQNESCGKCIPCREGTKQMLKIMNDIVEGKGSLLQLQLLEDVADTVKHTALCGLGKTAANPVLSTLEFFRDEYLAHIVDKKCPAKECKALIKFVIKEDLCKGCSKCQKNCPSGAISGKVKEAFSIDPEKCTKCGVCLASCVFKAIKEE